MWFLRKLIWFFRKNSRVGYAREVRHYKTWQLYRLELCLSTFGGFRGSFSGGREECLFSSIFLFSFFCRLQWILGEVCRQIFLSSKLQGVYRWRGSQYFWVFLNNASGTSLVNWSRGTSGWPLIIFGIGFSVISGRFPSRCSFHVWSFSSWPAAFFFFFLALKVLFLPFTLFSIFSFYLGLYILSWISLFMCLNLNVF